MRNSTNKLYNKKITHRKKYKRSNSMRSKTTKSHNLHKTRSRKKHIRKGGSGSKRKADTVFDMFEYDNIPTKELFERLDETSKREYKKKYHNGRSEGERRAWIENLLRRQIASEREIQRYLDDTENWMVEEPGVLPYDSRMDYTASEKPEKEKPIELKPIEYYDINDEKLSNRLKAAWQKKWDKESQFDINFAIHDPNSYKPFVKKRLDEYRAALANFVNTDPDYLKAVEDEMNKVKERFKEENERRGMEKEERSERSRMAKEKEQQFLEYMKKEKPLREAEEGETDTDFTVTWAGVKRRKLKFKEDRSNGKLTATNLDLRLRDNPRHSFPSIIVFSTPAEVAEAYSYLKDRYIPRVVRSAKDEPDVEKAIKRATSHITKAEAQKLGLKPIESRTRPGKFYTLRYGRTVFVE